MGNQRDLAAIVGCEQVLDNPGTLAGYARDQSFAPRQDPWLVVRPGDEAEVLALVRWANRTGVPLLPVSSGPPHFYGDTVPSAPGVVIVDLSRLMRIRRIDRRNRMVVLEPGVTYAQLQAELAKEGMRVGTPLLPRANKSVIASLLERQPTLNARYNYTLPEPLRNLGVVWGCGETTYTGEAGYASYSLEEQWQKGLRQVDPKGPAQTDFFRLLTGAQGSLGIVTWASVKCELLPGARKVLFAAADGLDGLTELAYRLQRLRLGDEMFLANDALLARLLGEDEADSAALHDGLSPWVLVVALAGRVLFPEERVEVQEEDLREVARSLAVEVLSELPGVPARRVEATLTGFSPEPYWKLRPKGGSSDIFFLTTLDRVPAYLATAARFALESDYPPADIGVYLQPQHQGVTWHCELAFTFSPEDTREAARVEALHGRLSQCLAAEGAYFSRPYGPWAEMVYERDPQSRAILQNTKKVFDPNNVLNPGKLCF